MQRSCRRRCSGQRDRRLWELYWPLRWSAPLPNWGRGRAPCPRKSCDFLGTPASALRGGGWGLEKQTAMQRPEKEASKAIFLATKAPSARTPTAGALSHKKLPPFIQDEGRQHKHNQTPNYGTVTRKLPPKLPPPQLPRTCNKPPPEATPDGNTSVADTLPPAESVPNDIGNELEESTRCLHERQQWHRRGRLYTTRSNVCFPFWLGKGGGYVAMGRWR